MYFRLTGGRKESGRRASCRTGRGGTRRRARVTTIRRVGMETRDVRRDQLLLKLVQGPGGGEGGCVST